MKRNPILVCFMVMLCVALASSVIAQSEKPESSEATVPAAFTYQGQIKRNGALFSGTCDLQFKMWDAAVAGAQQGATLPAPAVAVNNGVFAVALNFGNQFTGQARWIETAAKCANDSGFTTLPRVALNATPYAAGLMPGAVINGDIPYAGGNATFKATNSSASGGTAIFGHATAGSGATAGVFGLSNSPAGAGVWGRNDSFVGVLGESSSSNGVAGISATGQGVYGQSSSNTGVSGKSTTGAGVVGVSGPWVGVYGESSSFTGVWGKSTTGAGAAGESTDWIGVYGKSMNSTGLLGESTFGYGVHGKNITGFAMRADGNASQRANDGGWIKAMIHVDYRLPENIRIRKCFNSQATGTAVYTPPCGFSVTAIQNGYWNVNFGFNVSGRFIQANVWALDDGVCFVSDCESHVIELRQPSGTNSVGVTISYNKSGAQTNAPFTIIVY